MRDSIAFISGRVDLDPKTLFLVYALICTRLIRRNLQRGSALVQGAVAKRQGFREAMKETLPVLAMALQADTEWGY